MIGLHAVATHELGDALERSPGDAMPERIAVAYVRTIEPDAPPVVAPVAAPRPVAPPTRAPRRTAPTTSRAASEPAAAASSAPLFVAAASEPATVLPMADAGEATAAAELSPGASDAIASAQAPSGSASAAEPDRPPFVWPASTRVRYLLTGWYRGDVSGHAQVEWIRQDDGRYQVHLDIAAGPDFAPILTRRMTSEGRIAEHGLAPDRYDEDTQVVFRSTRRVRMRFETEEVVLADGKRAPRPAGVQDTASQFVQLTYLFTTQPERLRAGASVAIPLALPRGVDTWTYDVVERESLSTPFGAIDAFHLKPRRTSRPNGELTVEMWIAPELRYLPVRIRIRQSQENWADLVIDRKPEMAGGEDAPRTEETSRP